MENNPVLNTFLEYVKIGSESRNEKLFAQRVMEDLSALGLRVETDSSQEKTGSDTGNIYAFLDGDPSLEPILLSAHLDTVPPGKAICPVVENGIVKSAGDTVLGSDDKSGVAAIVEALREIVVKKLPHRPVEVVFTVCEEVGLLGAKHLDYSRLRAKNAVIFDNEGDVGTIVNQAPWHTEFSAVITGKAAHAGVAPEEGISAVLVAAEAVSQMKLLRVDQETTSNVGTFLVQGPNNIVPEKAVLSGEVRSQSEKKMTAQCAHIESCFNNVCQKYGARLQLTFDPSYEGYQFGQDSALIRRVKACCQNIGAPVKIEATGGGSDANIFNEKGISAVVVGTGMEKIHGVSEYMTLENLVNTKKLALELMRK